MKLKARLKEQLMLKKEPDHKRFQTVPERFGIGSVTFDETARGSLLYQRERAHFEPDAGKDYGTARLTVTSEEVFPEGCDRALTVTDLYTLLTASPDRLNGFPRLLNTLENRYSGITVIGNSPYAERVYGYYTEPVRNAGQDCKKGRCFV